VWKPNLVKVKTEIAGTTMTLKMCTRCLRSGYVTKKVWCIFESLSFDYSIVALWKGCL